MARKTAEERFWKKVDRRGPDDCWEWAAARCSSGYGNMWFNGRVAGAHRISWEIHNGPIPDCVQILHRCDNPGCVNPSHLFLGSHADNMGDKVRKGRHSYARGEKCNLSKLTREQVVEIRAEYATGQFLQQDLSEMYGVSCSAISHIITRYTWKHVIP